jgi:hypothetical protein
VQAPSLDDVYAQIMEAKHKAHGGEAHPPTAGRAAGPDPQHAHGNSRYLPSYPNSSLGLQNSLQKFLSGLMDHGPSFLSSPARDGSLTLASLRSDALDKILRGTVSGAELFLDTSGQPSTEPRDLAAELRVRLRQGGPGRTRLCCSPAVAHVPSCALCSCSYLLMQLSAHAAICSCVYLLMRLSAHAVSAHAAICSCGYLLMRPSVYAAIYSC